MKINYIKLNNIGPYYGEHKFDLYTNSTKNIILIGGKNGAGKTTFLKSIKYGLFGCFSMGLKNESYTYLKEISTILNNTASSNFYIEIEFELIENYEVSTYVINRSWAKINDTLIEKVVIFKDNSKLDEIQTREFGDKLRAITSPQLINSFIFDGEKISHCIEAGETADYLREVFDSIFNIDLISQTKKDLLNYISKKSIEKKSQSQIETVATLNKIDTMKNQLKVFENTLISNENSLKNMIALKKSYNDKFYALGGLTKQQQIDITKRIGELSKFKEDLSKNVKSFIESDLPLYLNMDLLVNAQLQLAAEKQMKYVNVLSEIEKLLGKSLVELKSELSSIFGECKIIHDCDNGVLNKVELKISKIKKSVLESQENLKKRTMNFDEYKLMLKQIDNNDKTEELNNILSEIKKVDNSIVELKNLTLSSRIELEKLENELKTEYEIYEKMNSDLKKCTLHDNSFNVARISYEICEKFSIVLTRIKLKEVSNIALSIFNDTIRKNDFISKININDNFELELYNNSMKKINAKILSAGEMQILISSLIWAMFKVSGRREMFIFDTPLARLDIQNRENFISKIISTISSQVVILSTDSEFIGDNLRIIDDKTYKKYLLEYDEKTGTSCVNESYFGGEYNEY